MGRDGVWSVVECLRASRPTYDGRVFRDRSKKELAIMIALVALGALTVFLVDALF